RGTLDNLDLGAGGACYVGEIDRGTIGQRERPRLRQNRDPLSAQPVDSLRQGPRRPPADVVDGMALAGLRVPFLHENPYRTETGRAVPDAIRAALELGALAAEFGQQPPENVIRV